MAPTLAPYLRVRPLTDVGIWRPRWRHIFPPDLRPAQHAPHLEDDAISKISVARPKTEDKQHPHSSRISVAEKQLHHRRSQVFDLCIELQLFYTFDPTIKHV